MLLSILTMINLAFLAVRLVIPAVEFGHAI